MNIAVYKDTFKHNRGADIAVRSLADGLAERGHEVTVFTKSDFDAKVRGGYDVIISTGTNEIIDLAKIEGLPPIIQQFHTDPEYPFRHWIKKWRRNRIIKAALKNVSAIQVLRDEHVETLARLGIKAPRIEVIGNWSSVTPSVEAASPKKIILFPGAFNKDKNQALLLKAFSRIASEFPEWEVHLYGRGKLKTAIPPRVIVHDFADLNRPYAECAFVAFPSKTEGFGLVIVEAAAFGKPTIAIRDWVGCGEVVGSSVCEFAAGLAKLMRDERYRLELGEKCRKYCDGKYAREKIFDQWERLIFDCLRS